MLWRFCSYDEGSQNISNQLLTTVVEIKSITYNEPKLSSAKPVSTKYLRIVHGVIMFAVAVKLGFCSKVQVVCRTALDFTGMFRRKKLVASK